MAPLNFGRIAIGADATEALVLDHLETLNRDRAPTEASRVQRFRLNVRF
jgi:hypothetical protein